MLSLPYLSASATSTHKLATMSPETQRPQSRTEGLEEGFCTPSNIA
jgi:hypothetical protein